MTLDPDTDLSFTRTVKAPRAVVWACWTTPQHLMQFFVPKPNSVTACDIDLRVGGRFHTTMNVEGQLIDNKGVFLEVVPETRLVFTDTYTEGWKPNPDPFMTAILDLSDDADGATIYTATARHRSSETRKMHEDMGFYDGWGTVVDQLEDYAKTLI